MPDPLVPKSKHDADCLRRKREMDMPYVCTCGLTDAACHRMIPGSHERPDGPECLCGQPWLRFEGCCSSQATAFSTSRSCEVDR